MAKTVERGRVPPVRHQHGLGRVADIQNDRATVDVADVGTVRPLGVHVDVMHPKTRIELCRHPCRWGYTVTLTRSGIPPPADFRRLRRRADIDDTIELIVIRMRGGEIGRPTGHMYVLTVDKPQTMHAPRVRTRGIEMGDKPG